MTETINGIPLYKAEINSDLQGVWCVSLVDFPAVKSNFLAFDHQTPVQKFAVADEEKRLIRGVLMRADYPIFRCDPSLGEFYTVFSAGTIRRVFEKYLKENRSSNINLMHLVNSNVEGVDLVQIFFKDTAAGIAPVGFEEIEEGSAFGEYHVTNDEVWRAVKEGTFRGFSIEGLFSFQPVEKPFNNENMNIKEAFRNVLVKMRAITTDKAVLVWDGEEDLKQGDKVYVDQEGEERKAAPDGDYTTEDGKTIKVVDGVVAEIVDPKAEVAPEEEAEDPKNEVPEEEAGTKKDEDELWAMINGLQKQIDALKKEIDTLREGQTKMSAQVEKFAQAPAATPAHEEFNERNTPEVTNKKAANASLIVAANRK